MCSVKLVLNLSHDFTNVGGLSVEYLWRQNIIDVEFASNYARNLLNNVMNKTMLCFFSLVTTHRCHYISRHRATQKLLNIFT